MTEPKSYGVVALNLANQLALLSKVTQRPWIKATHADVRSVVANDWNLLLTDCSLFDPERPLESAFAVLTGAVPRSAHGPAARHDASEAVPVCIAPFQIVNHLPCSVALTNSAALVRALARQYQGQTSVHPFDTTPLTYYFPRGTRTEADSPVLGQLYKRMAAISHGQTEGLRLPAKHAVANLWIVKPASCGTGAEGTVVCSPSEVASTIAFVNTDFVIQKYIERPLLVHGVKVTVRLHVLVTDSADVYVHRAGLVLLASLPYAPLPASALGSVEEHHGMHVTTQHVQAACPAYGRVAHGNAITLDQLQAAVDAQQRAHSASPHVDGGGGGGEAAGRQHSHLPPNVIHEAVVPRMKRIIVDAVRGAFAATMPGDPSLSPLFSSGGEGQGSTTGPTPLVNPAAAATGGHPRAGFRGRRCFELFGVDFVLDEDLRPWLLGFSENPDLSTLPSRVPDVASMVDAMLEEVVRVSVDPLLPAPYVDVSGGGGSSLPTPGFNPLSFALAARSVPTGSQALEACSRAQTRLASALARAAMPTHHRAGPGAEGGRYVHTPFTPALPPDVTASLDGPLPGFELVYRSMAAEDEESEAYVTMACAALAGKGDEGGGTTSTPALSSAVTAQISAAWCATLPPRARTLATVPSWAFTGPDPQQHALSWLEKAGGADAVLPGGRILVEAASPRGGAAGAPLSHVAAPTFLPPPSSPSFSMPSPQSTGGRSPVKSPTGHAGFGSTTGLGAYNRALSAAALSPPPLAGQDMPSPTARVTSQAVQVDGASADAAATAIVTFLGQSGKNPLDTASKLVKAMQGAVAAGKGGEPAAGMPGGFTNNALLSSLHAALPVIAQAAYLYKQREARGEGGSGGVAQYHTRQGGAGAGAAPPPPSQPQPPSGSSSRARSSSGQASGPGTKYSHVAPRVDTGAHLPPGRVRRRVDAPPAPPSYGAPVARTARGLNAPPGTMGRASRGLAPRPPPLPAAELATHASTLAPQYHASLEEGGEGGGAPHDTRRAFMRGTSTSHARASSGRREGGQGVHTGGAGGGTRIPMLSSAQRAAAYAHHVASGMAPQQQQQHQQQDYHAGGGYYDVPASAPPSFASPVGGRGPADTPHSAEYRQGERPDDASAELQRLLAGMFAGASPGTTRMPADAATPTTAIPTSGVLPQPPSHPTAKQPISVPLLSAAAARADAYVVSTEGRAGRQELLPTAWLDSLVSPRRDAAVLAAEQAVAAARSAANVAASVIVPPTPAPGVGASARPVFAPLAPALPPTAAALPLAGNSYSAYTSVAPLPRQHPVLLHAPSALEVEAARSAGQATAAALVQQYTMAGGRAAGAGAPAHATTGRPESAAQLAHLQAAVAAASSAASQQWAAQQAATPNARAYVSGVAAPAVGGALASPPYPALPTSLGLSWTGQGSGGQATTVGAGTRMTAAPSIVAPAWSVSVPTTTENGGGGNTPVRPPSSSFSSSAPVAMMGGGTHHATGGDAPPRPRTDSDGRRMAHLPPGDPLPAPPPPTVWVAVPVPPSSGGGHYYYHALTRETTWERPEGEGHLVVSQADVDAMAAAGAHEAT